jgi:2-dehydro-3-deoxyphosphogluconate aldolase/(4S)-4-hydroxy-2-oxoglutarate aldolase
MTVLQSMIDVGIIPVFSVSDPATAVSITKACSEGGAVCIEFTNRKDGAIDVFKKVERYCAENCPQVIIGVGSVTDEGTAAMYINAGANFVVGPNFDKETALLCNKRKIAYSPGCATISEIHTAETYGVEICKIFPGSQVGGPDFVKNVLAPRPWSSIMPTGGVEPTRESLEKWFKAGIVCAGIGSKLISKELVDSGDFATLSQKIKETVALVKEIRVS